MSLTRRLFCRIAPAAAVGFYVVGHSREAAGVSPGKLPAEVDAVGLDGDALAIEGAAIRKLAEVLDGRLLLRDDSGYDAARRIWNGMHDRYPALIVRARSTPDVAAAVDFARERRLLLAVKGGGHSWPGHSVADGALMLDLSELNGVLVDPVRRQATVGGGALLYDLDIATLRHDLVTTAGIVSHTGVGGLTLGGGYGRLGRKFGLTIDNLLAAKIVTADGRERLVNSEENRDLFWAIRGGGGNFGVVTEFTFSLHDIPATIYGGDMLWSIHDARNVLDYYAEHSATFPNEMFMAPGIVTGPDGAPKLAMDVCYCGHPGDAERELASLRAVARPVMDNAVPASYLSLQLRRDGQARPGVRSYIKSGMVAGFSPGLIDTLLDTYVPGQGVVVNSFATGGAIAEVGETDTAWPHRNAGAMIAALSFWPDETLDEARIGATREHWERLEPHTGGYYANIQADAVAVAENYGPVYDRLVSIKKRYDSGNLFRLNSNIRPG